MATSEIMPSALVVAETSSGPCVVNFWSPFLFPCGVPSTAAEDLLGTKRTHLCPCSQTFSASEDYTYDSARMQGGVAALALLELIFIEKSPHRPRPRLLLLPHPPSEKCFALSVPCPGSWSERRSCKGAIPESDKGAKVLVDGGCSSKEQAGITT